jgi:hypothetical protein
MLNNEGGYHLVVSQKEKEFAYKELNIFRSYMELRLDSLGYVSQKITQLTDSIYISADLHSSLCELS